ncbi:MAG TPA: respiratory nitrate reductase subunit gamma [Candidatus Methylomirabilis sp.]|nr:respiratory nitrate reductase subunit gamma [Candidatus Methylomirabilis sp.]
MTILLYTIIHAGIAVFLVACVVRAILYSIQPMHLRWELYPVPHEDAHRVKHGGSYFEEADWQTRPRRFNLLGELRFMLPEMLCMKGLWDWNRPLWVRSFPFHLGLYLLGGTSGLVVLLALLEPFSAGIRGGALEAGLQRLYTASGLTGIGFAMLGAVALLIRRLTAGDLKTCSTPGDIFNLCAFILCFGCLLAGYLLRGAESPGTVAVARAILTFDTSVGIPGTFLAALALSALLVAYIPFTHMSHFIGKFFTYHTIRWNDQPSLPGGMLEKKLAEYLTYRPTWAATHVGADGTKTWADVVSINPAQGEKK